jgi:hypothetical protein
VKRLLASSIVIVALLTACSVAEDTTAATVNGTDISVSAVAALAKTTYVSQAAESTGVGLVSSPPGTTGSATQRLALSLLVQAQVYEDGIADRKGSVTDIDQQAAEQQISEFESSNADQLQGGKLEPLVRRFFLRYLAAQAALGRILGGSDIEQAASDENVAAYYDEHPEEFLQVCLDGFAVQPAQEAAAQAAIDRGDAVAAIVADASLQAQPLSQDGAETCVASSDVTNQQLAEPVLRGDVGVWATTTLSDPQNGDVVVFIRPNTRQQLTLDDQNVVATITKTLQDAATTEAQGKLSGESTKILGGADVDVNPQYGEWDPNDQSLIVAPAVPSSKTTETTVPVLQGQ